MTVEQRRRRLARRHHLSSVAARSVTGLAEDLVGLHASDPATVYLSACARTTEFESRRIDALLYDERALAKHLMMRRTLFVVPTDLLPITQSACTDAIVATERKRLARDVERSGITSEGSTWLEHAATATLDTLDRLGSPTGAELSKAVPALRAKLTYAEGKKWGGEVGVATQIFIILAAEGRMARDRPRTGWTSSQHRWRRSSPPSSIDRRRAVAELTRRWLRSFGPATLLDITWWTGLGKGLIGTALDDISAVEVDLDGYSGFVLADDLDEEPPVDPWVALLPSLDPTTMGWKDRSWYLGDHAPRLFDRNGNAGPTIWCDGRIVGGWAQRRSGDVAIEVFDDIGAGAAAAIELRAAELESWLGATVITPRFPAPTDRALRA